MVAEGCHKRPYAPANAITGHCSEPLGVQDGRRDVKTETQTLTWTDGYGKTKHVAVNFTLDAMNFKGMAGFGLLVLAANPHLTIPQLARLLELNGCERSRAWIQKRRWMFKPPDVERGMGGRNTNMTDGKDAAALTIMRENPRLSLRDLVRLLAAHGIERGREWVRCHRHGLTAAIHK